MNPKIFELSPTDKKQVEANAQAGFALCQRILKTNDPINFAKLDKAFAALARDSSLSNLSMGELANELGCAFATLLQADLALSWFNISDHHGQEKALICDKTQSVIFPINAVLKRLEPEINPEPFFEAMSQTIKKHINF
jgi:hypothetical protein